MQRIRASLLGLLTLAICLVSHTIACGCYGPASCNLDGQLAFCTTEGVCDCCPVCNSCDQLFGGCAASHTSSSDLHFEPPFPSIVNLGQTFGQFFIVPNGPTGGVPNNSLLYPPCVRPDLPVRAGDQHDGRRPALSYGYRRRNLASYHLSSQGPRGCGGDQFLFLHPLGRRHDRPKLPLHELHARGVHAVRLARYLPDVQCEQQRSARLGSYETATRHSLALHLGTTSIASRGRVGLIEFGVMPPQ